MAENDVKTKVVSKQTEQKYSKARLMASEAYKKHRDLIGVILEENKSYTREEVK